MDAQSPMPLILIGQSELWDKLQLQSYAAIRQRVDLQCKLPHFDRAQVAEYMKRHLEYAGANHDIFSDVAIDENFRYSYGAARLVNKVCLHCLLYGTQNGRRIIDDHMVSWSLKVSCFKSKGKNMCGPLVKFPIKPEGYLLFKTFTPVRSWTINIIYLWTLCFSSNSTGNYQDNP
jgi:hypothetical protein